MILGHFTLVHVVISLVAIAAGFGVASGLLLGRLYASWAWVFGIATLLTSVTGFLFPFRGFTPAMAVGGLSILTLGVAGFALSARRPAGKWRMLFVIGMMLSLYLNCFVLVAQIFQKVPAIAALAPNQTELPFVVTQAGVLLVFIGLIVAGLRGFVAASPGRATPASGEQP